MANQQNQQPISEEGRPLVLVHRISTFKLSRQPAFEERLLAHFRLLDHPFDSLEQTQSFLSRHAGSVRAVINVGPTPISAEFLHLLSRLELIVSTSAGLDRIDLTECRCRGIIITNGSLAFCEDVADCAIGLLIDVLRRISAADRFVRGGLWPVKKDYPLGFKLGGKRVGIVRLGHIGSEIAKRLAAFGCSIAYNSRRQKPSVPFPFHANVPDLQPTVMCLYFVVHLQKKPIISLLGRTGCHLSIAETKGNTKIFFNLFEIVSSKLN